MLVRNTFSSASGWAVAVLAGLLCGLPILVVYHTRPIPTFYSELTAFAVFGLFFFLGWLARLTTPQGERAAASALAIPAGLVVVLFLQLATQTLQQPMAIFLAIGYGVVAMMAIQAGYWFSKAAIAERVLCAIAFAVLLAALLSSCAAWAQALSIEPHFRGLIATYEEDHGRRLFANLYQANHLATVLGLGMMAAAYLLARRLLGVWTYVAVLLILATATYLTVSRMPWLQMVVVCSATFMLLGDDGQGNHVAGFGRRTLLALAPVIALAAGSLLSAYLADLLNLRLDGTVLGRMTSGSAQESPRILLWRYAWQMFREHAILGVGWGEFTVSQYRLADRLGPIIPANNAHNLVLDLLAKTGAVGAALVLVPMAAWLLRVAVAVMRHERYQQRVFCVGMVGVVMVHAMLEFPLTYAYFLLPVCLLLGIAETSGVRLFGRSMSVALGGVACMLLCAAMIFALADYRRTEVAYLPEGQPRYVQDPALIFSDWGRYSVVGLLEPNRELVEEKIAMYEQAISLYPNPEYMRRYIVLLALHGEDERAMTNVVRLRTLTHASGDEHYRILLRMCDRASDDLGDFKAKLIRRFGGPATS